MRCLHACRAITLIFMLQLGNFAYCHLQQTTTTTTKQTQQRQQSDPHQQASSTSATSSSSSATAATQRNSAISRWNRQSSPHTSCEYKDLMLKLNDRVAVLATLDEDLRNRLESVDNKIVQFETSNLARLDSLGAQQMDFIKRMDSMELMERMTKHNVEELKGDFEALHKNRTESHNHQSIEKAIIHDLENDLSLSRVTRQATASRQNDTLNDSQKLDALAVYLTSAISAINGLQSQLQTNVTRLLQVTSNIQRRFNNVIRRTHGVSAPGLSYLPPAQTNCLHAGNLPQQLITSCTQDAPTTHGILKLQLTVSSEPFYVLCDERPLGGGWTVIMNRLNGDVNFQRDWLEYKSGFGNLAGEFFIGLEKLHALTASAVHELLIVMEDFENVQRYARYSLFAIGSEAETYALKLLGSYEGDAGDALTYHAGYKFSTYDNDNDGCVDCNCAQAHMGAWWYNWCEMSNLMGKYYTTDFDKAPTYQGMYWHHFHGPNYSLKSVKMLIRPVEANDATDARR